MPTQSPCMIQHHVPPALSTKTKKLETLLLAPLIVKMKVHLGLILFKHVLFMQQQYYKPVATIPSQHEND